MVNKKCDDGQKQKKCLKRSISPNSSHSDEPSAKKFDMKLTHIPTTGKENNVNQVQSELPVANHSSLMKMTKRGLVETTWHPHHSLWSNMINKTLDTTYQCRLNFLEAHPSITTKMRSILFDWLIEVCEVYKLHRETYHLSIAFIDYYLCNTNDLPKNKFQLLGITALVVAAKLEEIYPPKLSDFAYVTDNTCSEDDILDMELDLITALNWYLSPMTAISWLLIYLRVDHEISKSATANSRFSRENLRSSTSNSEFLKTSTLTEVQKSTSFLETFSLAVRLLDLCSLDMEYSQFSKHILAASTVLMYKSDWPVQQITGLTKDDLVTCLEWMQPFHDVLSESVPSVVNIRPSSTVPTDEVYSIQVHNISVDLLVNVDERRSKALFSVKTNRHFRDLANCLSWPLKSEKHEHGEQHINDNLVPV